MPRPYRIVAISFYEDDLRLVDEIVAQLKERGIKHASRSAVLRACVLTGHFENILKCVNIERKERLAKWQIRGTPR